MIQFRWRHDIEGIMQDESHDEFLSRLYNALQPGQIAFGWMKTREGHKLSSVKPRPEPRSFWNDLRYKLQLWSVSELERAREMDTILYLLICGMGVFTVAVIVFVVVAHFVHARGMRDVICYLDSRLEQWQVLIEKLNLQIVSTLHESKKKYADLPPDEVIEVVVSNTQTGSIERISAHGPLSTNLVKEKMRKEVNDGEIVGCATCDGER